MDSFRSTPEHDRRPMTDDRGSPTVDAEGTDTRRDAGRRLTDGYAAVVFDMDGTLVEFTGRDLRHETAVEAFDEAGIAPTDDELAAVVDGSTANARAVCRDRGVDPAAFYDPFDRLLAERQRAVVADGGKRPYDDALRALEELTAPAARRERADGGPPPVDVAVVSNNYQSVVDDVIERYFPDRFAVAYGTEPGEADRRRRKPDPHFLLRAVDDLGVDPAATLLVGDSADDVDAAAAAGVDVAHLRRDPDRGRSEPDPDAAPTYRVDGLDELLAVVTGG
ncbi:hypothetical protein BRD10_04550 [Halobacteriales archaeon SW_12_71_31]|nr:MAG: hypothetical protein BRD10_04550 [Halobacteriales archaeon SW_12_71_31]